MFFFVRHHPITRLAQKCKDWVRVFLAGLKNKNKKETPENREKHETGIKHVFHRDLWAQLSTHSKYFASAVFSLFDKTSCIRRVIARRKHSLQTSKVLTRQGMGLEM